MKSLGNLDELEATLLGLGKLELRAEHALHQLLLEGRRLIASGDDAGAESFWPRYDRAEASLKSLRERIYEIETALYSARRKLKR